MATVAFFTLNAYDMLTGGYESDAVGGAQLQQILIGKELSQRGHEVIFVEYNDDYKTEESIEGIRIVTKPRPTGSEPSRAVDACVGTIQTLRRIDPDICYRRVLNFELLPISFYCNLFDIRFIYGIAHDQELKDNPRMFSSGIKSTRPYKWVNRYAISSSDTVIAQNDYQYDLAMKRLNTTIVQIPNCYQTDQVDPVDWEFDPPVVFWAGRFHSGKQPEVVAQLANDIPDATFVMAGSPDDESLYTRMENKAQSIDNLVLIGHVPFNEIDHYFAAADLFLNTSDSEGFPNTFLQAWAQGTPVVSLEVDPNNILSSQGIGIVGDGSVTTLRDQIQELITDEERLQRLGSESQAYLRENHTVNAITNKYEQVFIDNPPD